MDNELRHRNFSPLFQGWVGHPRGVPRSIATRKTPAWWRGFVLCFDEKGLFADGCSELAVVVFQPLDAVHEVADEKVFDVVEAHVHWSKRLSTSSKPRLVMAAK